MFTQEDLDKINIEVAEKIMGWKWFPSKFYGTGQKILAPNQRVANTLKVGQPLWLLVPDYSCNISKAFEIVQKLLEHDEVDESPFALYRRYSDKAGPIHNYWSCSIRVGLEEYSADAKTAPLAICLAALKLRAEFWFDNIGFDYERDRETESN